LTRRHHLDDEGNLGRFMADILLPQQEVFERRVAEVSRRITTISESNTMAKLLHSNFNTWLNASSMSPVKLTQDLDEDKNGMISGDEFAILLGKMTGERPPQWVVEVVFSFVDADTATGIPISDWMAFLAASGLEIPESLFETPVIITGSLLIDKPQTHTGEDVTITASFNEPIDAYELHVRSSLGESEHFVTQQSEMDSPTFDEFVLDADNPGDYTVELLHLGVRLDTAMFTITEPPVVETPEPVEEPRVEDASAEDGPSERPTPLPATGSFSDLTDALARMRLRSETQAFLANSGAHEVRFTVLSTSRTLLGEGAYKNGSTLTCQTDEGTTFELMVGHAEERSFAKGEVCHAVVQPHSWSVALRRLVCLEQ
jgi:hypothetical protein